MANINAETASNYYTELKKYYDLKDRYFNLSVEMTDKEENELCEELTVQENKVADMLCDLMEQKVDRSTVLRMMIFYRDRLFWLIKKLHYQSYI